jgi:adenine deaminase
MMTPDVNLLKSALGEEKADIGFLNGIIFNPFTCEWLKLDFFVKCGIIVGIADSDGKDSGSESSESSSTINSEPGYRAERYIDLKGAKVIPGLIDSHVHIESSLLTPFEYARLVIPHGTTAVIADPHEIANVAGIEGVNFMIRDSEKTPISFYYMAPGCVPATPMDRAGAELNSEALKELSASESIIGLGEMMNFPGVIFGDSEVQKKLGIFDIIDGHSPQLSGKELNAYISQGIESDHECVSREEALEKLRKGMYIYLREGSTEKNLSEIAGIVNCHNSHRCSFCTDDRHADMLYNDGHIDDCIRKAVSAGISPETAIKMATLSPAERFGLKDRGALSPGRRADFCTLADSEDFRVSDTYIGGVKFSDVRRDEKVSFSSVFNAGRLKEDDLKISGSGYARIIGINQGQIITGLIVEDIDSSDIPDLNRDIIKAVVCDRYRAGGCGVGLINGLQIREGAICASISHDSHNIVAAGASDAEIIRAVNLVRESCGGMAAVCGDESFVLPLDIGGIMSSGSYAEVIDGLKKLEEITKKTGSVKDPFMYLSFIALTVIPALRITQRGLFDVSEFSDVPLFKN